MTGQRHYSEVCSFLKEENQCAESSLVTLTTPADLRHIVADSDRVPLL